MSDMEDYTEGTSIEIFSGKNSFKLYAVKNNEIQNKISIPKLWIEGKHCTIHCTKDVEIKVEGTILKISDEPAETADVKLPEDDEGCDVDKSVEIAGVDKLDSTIINPILLDVDAKKKQDEIIDVKYIKITKDVMKSCKIVHYESSSEFYVTLNEYGIYQQFIEDESTSSINGPFRGAPICEPQSQCLLVDGEFKYSRGLISHLEEDDIFLRLLDIGKNIVVKKDMLADIPEKINFNNIPAQAIKCTLHRCRNNVQITDSLKFLVATKSKSKIHFIGCSKNGTWNVSLIRTSDILVKEYEPIFMALGYAAQPKLESGNVFIGYTDIDTKQLWLQKEEESDTFDQLSTICGTDADKAEPLHAFNIGDPCLCKSVEDSEWYRAVICSYDGAGQVMVQYIDFGNRESLPCSNVKSLLKDDIMKHTPLAYPCIIKDSQKLSDFVKLNKMLDTTVETTIHGKVGPFYEVTLTYGGMNVIDKISPEDGFLVQSYIPKIEEEVNLIPTHVEDDGRLWMQDTSQSNELDEIMDLISKTPEIPVEPSLGLFCCCKFTEDDTWYRATIISLENGILVRYIDYGNTEITTADRMKSLDIQSSKLQCQSVECCLFDECKNEVMKSTAFKSIDYFGSGLDNEYSAKFIKHEEHGLVLSQAKMTNGDGLCEAIRKVLEQFNVSPATVDVYDSQETVVVCDLQATVDVYDSQATDDVYDSPVTLATYNSIQPLPVQNNVDIPLVVTEIDTDGYFWVQSLEQETEFISLASQITTMMNGPVCKLSGDITTGMFCIAMYSLDSVWYRSVITDIEGDTCKIRFVDYGNSDTVSIGELYILPADMMLLPCQAVKCQFKILLGKEITEEMSESISKLAEVDCISSKGKLEEIDGQMLLNDFYVDGVLIDNSLISSDESAITTDESAVTPPSQCNGVENIQENGDFKEFEVGTWQNEEYSAIKENICVQTPEESSEGSNQWEDVDEKTEHSVLIEPVNVDDCN